MTIFLEIQHRRRRNSHACVPLILKYDVYIHVSSFQPLVQAIWTTGSVPTQMSRMIVVLLPKGGGDYRGIGLLNPIRKVVKKVMVYWFTALKLHDCLHGGLP